MSEIVVAFVTCEGREQAEEIAEKSRRRKTRGVCERIARSPVVLRVGREADVVEEVLLLLKTTRAGFDALKERVRELHSYEVPEIVGMRVEAGLGEVFGLGEEWSRDLRTHLNAFSRSAMRSLISSMPTEMRTSPSVMPSLRRWPGGTDA